MFSRLLESAKKSSFQKCTQAFKDAAADDDDDNNDNNNSWLELKFILHHCVGLQVP
jgi:hypothetical protein